MAPVKAGVVLLMLGTAMTALAGCTGSSNCSAKNLPDAEQASMSFDLCGTTFRWDGAADTLAVVDVGKDLDAWSELRLLVGRSPDAQSIAVLAIEYGEPASRDSPLVRSDEWEPFTKHAAGGIATGDTFFFCRVRPVEAAETEIILSTDLPHRNGVATIPAQVRAC